MGKILILGAGPTSLSARALQAMLPHACIVGIDLSAGDDRSIETTLRQKANGIIEIVAMRELEMAPCEWVKPQSLATRYEAPGRSRHKKGKR